MSNDLQPVEVRFACGPPKAKPHPAFRSSACSPSRVAFEEWATTQGLSIKAYFDDDGDAEYDDYCTAYAYDAWTARATVANDAEEASATSSLLRAVESAAKEIEWAASVFEGYTHNKPTIIGVDNALARLP